MEDVRFDFDVVARRLGAASPRRQLFGHALAAGLGVRAFGRPAPATAARRKKKGCPAYRQCSGGCCPANQVCLNGTCFKSCPAASLNSCVLGGACGSGCTCAPTAFGWGVCARPGTQCPSAQPPCPSTDRCAQGQVCLASGCCSVPETQTCWLPCGT